MRGLPLEKMSSQPSQGFNDKMNFDFAIAVSSVEEEYRTISETRCLRCGGRLLSRKQTLLTDDKTNKHYDQVETACVMCGTPREFLFDINSFFGKSRG